MALILAVISSIVTVLLHPTSKIFRYSRFFLINLLFLNVFKISQNVFNDYMQYYQQLYTRDAHDFQWYQLQWKTDMRNRTP